MRVWFCTALLGVMVGLAAYVVITRQEQSRVLLASGSELQVLHVSIGTNHVYLAEPIWKRTLRRILPSSLESKLGTAPGETLATRYSTLVVWLRSRERAPGGMRDAFALIDGTNGFPGHASPRPLK